MCQPPRQQCGGGISQRSLRSAGLRTALPRPGEPRTLPIRAQLLAMFASQQAARPGAVQHKVSFWCVPGERRPTLELDFCFCMTAKFVQQVASDTVQEVVPVEGAFLLELVDKIEPGLGTK